MRADRTYRVLVRGFAGIFRILRVRIDIIGAENLPRTGPAILTINHTSYLDFAFVGYLARERGRLVRFLAKKSAFDSRLTGPPMRLMGHISVDRWSGASAYRQARRSLGRGEVIGVFPEATISRSWLLKRFKSGASGLAFEADVPLLPCLIWGAHRIATVDRRPSLRRSVAVTIILGEPIRPRADEDVNALNRRLREKMEQLLEQAMDAYPDRPRGADDRWWIPQHRGGTAPDFETGAALDRAALARIGAPSD